MPTVAKGSVLLTPKFDNLTSSISRQLDSAFAGSSGIGSKAGVRIGAAFSSGLGAKVGAVAGIVSAVTGKAFTAISNSLDSAISRVDTMNNFPKVMAGLGYGADAATSSIDKMSDHLTGLPTRLDAMTSSVQKIVPTVKDVGKATDIMLAFNDALLAGGASTQVQEAALEQFCQVLAKGKPEMEDWRSIVTAMPGQMDQVAKSMLGPTASTNDLYNALKTGKVSVEDLEDAFISLDKNGYAGFDSFAQQAKTGTAGIATSMANLRNSVTKAVAACINAIGVENITAPIQAATGLIKGAGDIAAGAISSVKDTVSDVASHVERFIGMLERLGRSSDSFSTLAYNADVLMRAVRGALEPAVDTVGGVIDRVAELVGQTFTSTWPEDLALGVKRAADAINGLVDGAGGIEAVCSSIRGPVSGLVGDFDGAANSVLSFVDSSSGMSAIADAVSRFVGSTAGLAAAKLAISGVTGGIDKFKSLQVALKGVAKVAGSGVGEIGSLASMVSGEAAAAFASASGPVSGLFSAIGSGAGAFATLVGPIAIVVASVAALAAGFAYMMATNEGFRSSVTSAASAIASGLAPAFSAVASAVASVMPTLVSAFAAVASVVTGRLLPALGNIALALLQLLAAVAPVVGQIIAAVAPVAAQIIQLLVQVAGVIMGVLVLAVNAIAAVVQTVWPVVQAAFTVACAAISAIISTVWPAIQAVITTVMQVISAVIGTVLAAINGDWEGVWTGIQSIAEIVWNAIQTIVNVAIGVISSVISSVLSAISGVWSSTWGAIKGAFSSIWEGIKSAAQSGVNSVYTTVTGIKDKITGFFAGAGSWLVESGKAILNGLKSGIESAVGAVTSSVSGAVERIRGLFPFSPAKWGPFSGHGYTTYSGRALMGDFGESIVAASAGTAAMASKALARVEDVFDVPTVSFAAADAAGARSAAIGTAAPAGLGIVERGDTYYINIDGSLLEVDERIARALKELIAEVKRSSRSRRG